MYSKGLVSRSSADVGTTRVVSFEEGLYVHIHLPLYHADDKGVVIANLLPEVLRVPFIVLLSAVRENLQFTPLADLRLADARFIMSSAVGVAAKALMQAGNIKTASNSILIISCFFIRFGFNWLNPLMIIYLP